MNLITGPHLLKCDEDIKNAFKDTHSDVLNPIVQQFLSTFYEKMEPIGDMMMVLRMPKTLPTFRPMHKLYRSLGPGNLTVLCW